MHRRGPACTERGWYTLEVGQLQKPVLPFEPMIVGLNTVQIIPATAVDCELLRHVASTIGTWCPVVVGGHGSCLCYLDIANQLHLVAAGTTSHLKQT